MMFKPKTYLLIAVITLPLIFIGIVIGLWLYLPIYIESQLIPQLVVDHDLPPLSVRVRRIGLSGTDLSSVVVGQADRTPLKITTIHVDYTLAGLFKKKIQAVTVNGLQLDLTQSPDGIGLTGLTMPARSSAAIEQPATPLDLATALPVELKHLRLIQAKITFRQADQVLTLPLDADLDTAQLRQGQLSAIVDLQVRDNPLRLTAALDSHDNHAGLNLQSEAIVLDRFADLIHSLIPVEVSGVLDLQAQADVQIFPLHIQNAKISANLRRTKIQAPKLTICNLSSENASEQPIQLQVTAQGIENWNWSLYPFQVAGPTTIRIDTLQGNVMHQAGIWQITAQSQTLIQDQVLTATGLGHLKPLALVWDLNAEINPNGQGSFSIQSKSDAASPSQVVQGRIAEAEIHGQTPALNLTGTFDQNQLTANLDLTLGPIRVKHSDSKLRIAEWRLGADMIIDQKMDAPHIDTHFKIKLPNIYLTQGTIAVKIPQTTLQGEFQVSSQASATFCGDLRLAGAHITDTQSKIKIQGISAHLPLYWPLPSQGTKGDLKVKTMHWNGRDWGNLQGHLFQQGSGFGLDAAHYSKLFSDLIVYINGDLDSKGGQLRFRLPPYTPKADIDLGVFLPIAAEFKANGRLALDGQVMLDTTAVQTKAHLKVENGLIRNKKQEIDIQGIAVDLDLLDLLNLCSSAEQQLQIKNLQMGNLSVEDLKVAFQIEPGGRLFVEQGHFQWCMGTVSTNALRITPGKNNYDLTLFCDRLNLAQVLAQLGAAKASGQGAVNGRIPLRWANGRLSFDNGFLFSTPGLSGTIQLTETEFILACLPPGTPQHTQLDIAVEALKDYTYQWAKVHLDSQGQNLLVKLQLNGKPNQMLPFAYDQNLGRFKRVDGRGQADFQGINIDLNLRTPLNKILKYKQLWHTKTKHKGVVQ